MTQSSNPTWYDILGVGNDATPEEIKSAWRAATDKFEPGSGTSHFRLFNEAADVLLDPDRRAAYDAELAGGDAPPPAGPDAVSDPSVAVDLRKSEAADVDRDVDDEVPAVDVETGTAPDEPARSGLLGALATIPALVLALLAVVMVAAAVLAVVAGVRVHNRAQVFDAGPDASAAAERAMTSVLSYDYQHMEADRDRAARFLTPAYRKQYLKNFNDLLTKGPDGSPGPAVKTQAVVKADVLDTGIVDAESDRVRVIVFVNQSSVKAGGQPTIFQDRVVATMVHRGDSWLVDNIKSY
jgi:Mce-associated membrane protein